MENIFNDDFQDFIKALNYYNVEYVKGLNFKKTFAESNLVEVDCLFVRLINYHQLIKAKDLPEIKR